VDAALRLGLGHTLDAMGAALELEDRVGAVPLDRKGEGAIADRQRLGLEAAPLRVAGQHPVEVARPDTRLVAADTGTNLDDDVLVVVGVALHHRQANLLLELLEPLGGGAQQIAEFRVVAVLGQQLASTGGVVCHQAVFGGQLGRLLQVSVGTRDLGELCAVTDHGRVGEIVLELAEAGDDLFHKLIQHVCSSLGWEPSGGDLTSTRQ
jgi:hypothetical protein